MENSRPEGSEAVESRPSETPGTETRDALFVSPRRDGRNACLAMLTYLLFYQITLRVPFDSAVVVALSTLVSLVVTLLCAVYAARALVSPSRLAVCLGITALLVLPSIVIPQFFLHSPTWAGWRTLGPAYGAYRHGLTDLVPGLRDMLLLLLAVSVGVLVSRLIREIKILLPLGIVLALMDVYVVFGGGLVTQAQQGSPTAQAAMKNLTVSLPAAQKTLRPNAAPIAVVGFADYLFIALFFACFLRFGIPARRTFAVLCVTLVAYMAYGSQTGTDLPALVPIAAVIILTNLRQFRYERSEGFALLYAGLLVAAILGGLFFFSHR